MSLTADPSRCVGAGHCVRSAPEVFDQSEDGTVVLLRAEVPESDGVLDALDLCPSLATRLG
nr:ferredoxin [Actinokineospora inagensis]